MNPSSTLMEVAPNPPLGTANPIPEIRGEDRRGEEEGEEEEVEVEVEEKEIEEVVTTEAENE